MKYFVVVVLLLIITGSGYWIRIKKNVESTVGKVANHMVLPNEVPTEATVSDKEKLEGKFFAKAELGDKVLIYSIAGKAILYRPSTDKIIEVGPVVLTDNNPEPGLKEQVKLEVMNGSKESELASKFADDVFSKIDNITVTGKTTAKNKYEKTMIVILNEKFSDVGQGLAEGLNANISEMPKGEQAPDADIVVILGNSHL